MKKDEFIFPSRIESVEKAAQAAADFASESDYDANTAYAIDMAVREAMANAIKHGNKEDQTKSVEITFENLEEGFEVTIRDFGEGFAVEQIPDPTNAENILKASGRGILFMRSFMDEVVWSNHAAGGMIVKMLKRR